MITILNGKLTIPECRRFIGFAGDNLSTTIEFIIMNQSETDRIYRLYLTFDDGTVNYFTLPAYLDESGVVLTWNVKREHIFKSGNVQVQIKGFAHNGVVYHTTPDTFFVGNSAEFSDYLQNNNTEFLQYEEKLNSLKEFIDEARVLTPYIGNNGNWFIYDSTLRSYKDSGFSSAGKTDSNEIASGAVTSEKIALGAIDKKELFSEQMQKSFLSLPVQEINISGDITEEFYDGFVNPGIYQIDTYSGVHQVLVTLKPASASYLMQILFEYDKVLYRGIFCSVDGVYEREDWTQWRDLCKTDFQEFHEVGVLGEDADPHFLSYQSSDPTTNSNVRIPLSVLKNNLMKIADEGHFFESKTIEGALQELGAEIYGIEELLESI